MERIFSIVMPAIPQTLYMVFVSTFFALLLGVPIGVLLIFTRPEGLHPIKNLYKPVNWVVNILRSLPFIILMFLLFPLSRIIVGKTIGTTAAIVPLSISAAPFVARLIETYLLDVDRGVIEAATAMGAGHGQIIKIMFKEAMPNIISGITMTVINLIGYSAMAGIMGGGGLGDIAGRYGYQRNELDILWVSVLIIIIMVQLVQFIGTALATKINKK
ncbi:MAG: methionine ABC transporter permease [Tissierellia bacterium]|nr:methionine ABC transporter permease [Tissierellia bacterium]